MNISLRQFNILLIDVSSLWSAREILRPDVLCPGRNRKSTVSSLVAHGREQGTANLAVDVFR